MAEGFLFKNRLIRVFELVFGDGVRLPAAISSSGGETMELLKMPNIFFSLVFGEGVGNLVMRMRATVTGKF